MRIYLLLAHPDSSSFNGALADAYEQAAQEKGHDVRRQNLGDLSFDPILRKGYKVVQDLEPDLVAAQEHIKWCQHWVIIYPVWWGSVPALLKGFFDRVLLPGFAYRPHDHDPFWDKLLTGRTAHIVTTSDAPSLWLRLQYWNSDVNTVRNATLNYCGFSSVKVARLGQMKFLSEEKRRRYLARMRRWLPGRVG